MPQNNKILDFPDRSLLLTRLAALLLGRLRRLFLLFLLLKVLRLLLRLLLGRAFPRADLLLRHGALLRTQTQTHSSQVEL